MQLFYEPEFDLSTKRLSINPLESRHIAKVLRKAIGDAILVTNGKGLIAKGVLIQNHPKKCEVEVSSIDESQEPKQHLHIAIAPTKANDRFEWFLEKAAEIGIQEITPLLCEHSERRHIKLERYEKVLQAAMKQSLSPFLPKLNELTPCADFLTSEFESNKLIAHCEDQPKVSLVKTLQQDNLILIGPEGDFSLSEIDLALQRGYQAVSLSESRLRTETAGVVACHTVNLIQSL